VDYFIDEVAYTRAMKRQYTIALLILIVSIGAFLRFWDITSLPPGLYPDEAMNGTNANEAIQTGNYKIFYPENNGREGIFMNIQSVSMRLFGGTDSREPWMLRIVSALFGTLTVLGVYFLAKELFYAKKPNSSKGWFSDAEAIGLASSFFIATLFWHINFSRIGFRAIMMPFVLVWSSYFIFRMLRSLKEDKKDSLKPELFALLGGSLFSFGFYGYLAYRVAPLLLLVPLVRGWKEYKKETLKKCFPCIFTLMVFVMFITALPIGYYFLNNFGDFGTRSAQVSVFASPTMIQDLSLNILKTLGMFVWNGDYNWRHNYSGAALLWWPVALLFIIGLTLSLKKVFQSLRSPGSLVASSEFFLLWMFAVMSIPVVISNEGMPHALRAIGLIPSAVIWAGVGLVWFVRKISAWLEKEMKEYPRKKAQLQRIGVELGIVLVVFFGAVTVHAYTEYFLRWGGNPSVPGAFTERYTIVGHYLKTLPQETRKYVIVNTRGLHIRGLPIEAQPIMYILGQPPTMRMVATKEKVTYLLVEDAHLIPSLEATHSQSNAGAVVVPLDFEEKLQLKLHEIIPSIKFEVEMGELLVGKINR
jgi:hypothetical protein